MADYSSISNVTNATNSRLFGLSGSGMDIDSLVKKGMAAQQARMDAVYKKQVKVEWKKEDYNTLNTDIKAFRDSLSTMKLQTNLTPKAVTTSNSSVVGVTANADAAVIPHTLEISSLADGVRKTSTDAISLSSNKSTMASQFALSDTGTYDFNMTNGTKTVNISGSTSDSIYSFIQKVNNAGLDIVANYDSVLDRVSFVTKKVGESVQLGFSSATGDAVSEGLYNALKINGQTTSGTNANVKVDGVNVSLSSNTFTLSGINYTLKDVTASPVRITVEADNAKTVENVKAFIDSYNKLLGTINGKLNETIYKGYEPLTDTEKAAITEEQAKQIEERARKGLFRRDSILTKLSDDMRNSMMTALDPTKVDNLGSFTTLSSIGISTSKGDYSEQGKLYVDEEKLKSALASDPDIVYKLFSTDNRTDLNADVDASKNGVMARLYRNMTVARDGITKVAGNTAKADANSTLGKEINSISKQIKGMADAYKTQEDMMYKKYSAMEMAISKSSSQMNWLARQ